jgi:hypothetical protein
MSPVRKPPSDVKTFVVLLGQVVVALHDVVAVDDDLARSSGSPVAVVDDLRDARDGLADAADLARPGQLAVAIGLVSVRP